MRRVRLKSYEELKKSGYVYSTLYQANKVVLTNGMDSWKTFDIDSLNKEFVVDDNIKVLSNEELETFKELFVLEEIDAKPK
jgi:hypothetical protein